MGAASYIQGKRVTRPTSLRAYEEWLDGMSSSEGPRMSYMHEPRILCPGSVLVNERTTKIMLMQKKTTMQAVMMMML